MNRKVSVNQEDDRQRASALIVAIAVLFIMFLLASVLATLSTTESLNAKSFSDAVQARMLARSGIQHALSSEEEFLEAARSYQGEDWDGNRSLSEVNGVVVSPGVGAASGSEDTNGNRNGRLDRKELDPRFALHPSFAEKTPDGRPKLVAIRRGEQTVFRGYSGRVPSSYGRGTDTYTVRVEPVQGVNVNSLNPNLRRLINNLCEELDACDAQQDPGKRIVGPYSDIQQTLEDRDDDGDQERVIETSGARPTMIYDPQDKEIRGGFQQVSDLRTVLTESNFEVLREELIIDDHATMDTSLIRPQPQNTDLTFDENEDCPDEAGLYHDCRVEGNDGRRSAYPLPDEVPGEPKAIRGAIDDREGRSSMTHTETVRWVNNPGDASPGGLPSDLSEGTKKPYGAFRYNFDFKRQPRALVNVNVAKKETLVSLITDLRARVVEITQREIDQPGGETEVPYIEERWFNPMIQTRVIPNPDGPNSGGEDRGITPEIARDVADRIIAYRNGEIDLDFRGRDDVQGPFETWPEFEAFVEQVIVDADEGSSNEGLGLSNDIGHLLKAHFNPNTRFGKFNWNSNGQWSWVSDGQDCSSPPCEWQGNRVTIDKTDFLYYTNEFTFIAPSHYEVSSYGRVLGNDQSLQAGASLRSVVRAHRMARHTTQADFEINEQEHVLSGTTQTYPENVPNVNEGDEAKRIQRRVRNGSGLSGQLAATTRTDYAPASAVGPAGLAPFLEWGFDEPDESTRGRWNSDEDPEEFTVNQENNPHMPFSWFSREYNDVGDDGGPGSAPQSGSEEEENHGLLSGKWNPGETEDYPWNESESDNGTLDPSEDPYNYSDLAPDGMLMFSERYRSIRYLTTHGPARGLAGTAPDVIPYHDGGGVSRGNANWNEGHVEFWWKPRALTFASKSEQNAPSGQEERIIYPLWSAWLGHRGISTGNGDDSNFMGYWAPHHYCQDEENGSSSNGSGDDGCVYDIHELTQQPHFAWKESHRTARHGGSRLDPVRGGGPANIVRWEGRSGAGASAQRVGRPPVAESQRWAGYGCEDMQTYDDNSANWQGGSGTVARIQPDNGCLHAYPGIQFTNVATKFATKFNYIGEMAQGRGAGHEGRAFSEIPSNNPGLKRAPARHTTTKNGSGNGASMVYNGYTKYYEQAPESNFNRMASYYYRSYFVREPQDSNRSSKWVFKVSFEPFLDMDSLEGPEASPPPTTQPRDHFWDMDNVAAGWSGGRTNGYPAPRSNAAGGEKDELYEAEVIATLSVDEKSGTARKKVTPKPGKWTRVTLEWDAENFYSFEAGKVGPGVSYPIYVPWDMHPDMARNMSAKLGIGRSEISGNRQDWLPIVRVPVDGGTNVINWLTEPGGANFPSHDNNRSQNMEYIVPHIDVNGEKKTRTDLYMGNINPLTGRFQPPPLLYAEHVVWSGGKEAGSEEVTAWHYIEHNTLKHYGNIGQFGSNFARRTKHYGGFGKTSTLDQTASGNWTRFYDDGFAGGTVDELIWSNDNTVDEPEENGPSYQVTRGNPGRYKDVATYKGRFHRADSHSHSDETYWDSDNDEEKKEKFNGYAREDRTVLKGDLNEQLRVVSLAHTQYRPRDAHYQKDYHRDGSIADGTERELSESERPYFEVSFKTGSGSWQQVSGENWYGAPISPEDVFDENLTIDAEDELTYRLELKDPKNRSALNITPFFEDLTVLYRRSAGAEIVSVQYF